MRLARTASVIAESLTLVGCQLSYEIEIALRDGQAVFLLTSGSKPATVQTLIVSPVAHDAAPVWEIESSHLNGQVQAEIIYGVVPAGMVERTKASPLQIGQIYRVGLLGLGGIGEKQFVIIPGPGPEKPIVQLVE